MNCPHVGTLLTLEKKSPVALCLLSTFAIQISNDPSNVQVYSISHTNKLKIYLHSTVFVVLENTVCHCT